MIKGVAMKSTRSVDDQSKYGINFVIEPEDFDPKTSGFLGMVVFLFVIYAMTSRPVLYAGISEWISQLLELKFFINIGG